MEEKHAKAENTSLSLIKQSYYVILFPPNS